MALVNVRRDVPDAFYRYKMERIQTKIEGKGNGIKTVVVNLSSVAQSLSRPGAYVIKYFGFELGAQTNIDPPDDRWIINGAHDSAKLQDYLDGFINKFVLCKKCKNPETDVHIKDDRIVLDCKACGQRTDVDLRLKLSGYILKNQPKKGKKDKAERKAARRANKQAQQNGNSKNGEGSGGDDNSEHGSNSNGDKEDDAGSDDDAFTRKIIAGAKELDKEIETKEDDWAVDMSSEAVKARQQQLPGELKQKLVLNGEDDDEEGEGGGPTVYDELGDWILAQAGEKGGIDKVDSLDIYVKAKELGIETKHRTVLVLVQTLFEEDKAVAQAKARAGMLKQIINDSERHQRALLGGTERFIAANIKEHPDVLDKVVKIFHQYYNLDLVSEEVFEKWGSKGSKKYVEGPMNKKIRKTAEPFLNWLAEAEEEESDDE